MTNFRKTINGDAFDPTTGARVQAGVDVAAWIDSLPPLEPLNRRAMDLTKGERESFVEYATIACAAAVAFGTHLPNAALAAAIENAAAERKALKRSLCDAQSDASSFMEQLHELQERVNTKSDYERGFDVGFSCGREGRADSVSKMHRRAQRAESDVALMSRQSHHWRNAYERMTQIVCDAWDALPVHIREEIESPMLPSGAILPQPRDLVRGVSMLADETRTCDVCGATGELDSRCGRCIR